jgi:hypothetical protein
MKRVFLILSIAALVLPAAALGNGPSGASIDGPDAGGEITFTGDGESGGTQLGNLTQQAGFFAATFGQEPDPMLASRPKGDLGPKYTITYTVPGPNNELDQIRQDVYPYAKPAPVTYTEPGQTFFGTESTRGGWFQADAQLKATLVAAGLPARASADSAESSSSFQIGLVSLLALAILLAAATAVFLRRRARPATA